MGRKTQIRPRLTTATIRMDAASMAEARLHGRGEISEGARNVIGRNLALMRASQPALTEPQARAVVGAMGSGFPGWASPGALGRIPMGPALAKDLADFCWREPAEAEDTGLDADQWTALIGAAEALTDVQALALCHAAEAFIEDTETGPAAIRRHFRVMQ